MSVDAIQKELESMAPEEQDSVMSFLAALRIRRDEERRRAFSEILDNKSPGFWRTHEDLQQKLAEIGAHEADIESKKAAQ